MAIRQKIANWFADRRAVRKLVTAILQPQSFLSTENTSDVEKPEQLVKKFRGWTYACASRNARAVAQVPLRLYAVTNQGQNRPNTQTRPLDSSTYERFQKSEIPFIRNKVSRATHIEEVLDHPFLDLMAKANPVMDGFEVLELIQLYQELTGDGYLYKVKDNLGRLKEVWPLLAHKVTIVPSPTTFIARYEYGDDPDKVVFKPEEVAHFRFPNPEDYFYGLSPLAAAFAAVNMQNNMDKYEDSLFKNNARPDQILIPELPVREEARHRLESEFNRLTKGVAKGGKTIVMPYGVKLEQLSLSPKELSYLMGRKTTRDDVCAIFDIPPTLLAQEQGNRAKDEAAEYIHAKYGIAPRVKRLDQRLNQDIVSEYDSRLFCAHDDPVPEDKRFRLEEQTAHLRSGYSSINEERELDGRPPVEWGEKPLIPVNMTPLGTPPPVSNKPDPNNPPKDEDQHPLDKPHPGRQKSPAGKKALEELSKYVDETYERLENAGSV
jgi:HK97 family phage portal protein